VVLFYLRSIGYIAHLKGAILNYGCFDLTYLPSARLAQPETTAILATDSMYNFLNAFMPNTPCEDRKAPEISPAYNDLRGLCHALFLVGTEDSLIDDSVLMHFRWLTAGNKALFKLVPGAPHAFMTFDGNNPGMPAAQAGWRIMVEYILERLKA